MATLWKVDFKNVDKATEICQNNLAFLASIHYWIKKEKMEKEYVSNFALDGGVFLVSLRKIAHMDEGEIEFGSRRVTPAQAQN